MASSSFFNRKTISGFIGWSLLWMLLQMFMVNRYIHKIPVAFTDALITISFITAACLIVVNNFRYYLPGKDSFWYIIVISLVLGGIATGISTFLLHLIFMGETSYHSLVSESWLLRFALSVLLIACTGIVGLLWYSLQEGKEKERRSQHAEKMLKEAELYKLRQQLQPHFLFNSLNSISALTLSDATNARHMIQQLSDFLRSTLQRNESQFITLREELHQLSLYLDIEKVRFGHRLQTSIESTEESSALLLPALLLQPAVENAIKFGLYDTLDDVLIEIKTKREEDSLVVTIINPYDSETVHPAQGTGFGLPSIRRRLYLLFGREDLVQTVSSQNIFTTTIRIPSSQQTNR